MKYLLSLIFYYKMDDNSVSIEVHESFGVSKYCPQNSGNH